MPGRMTAARVSKRWKARGPMIRKLGMMVTWPGTIMETSKAMKIRLRPGKLSRARA